MSTPSRQCTFFIRVMLSVCWGSERTVLPYPTHLRVVRYGASWGRLRQVRKHVGTIFGINVNAKWIESLSGAALGAM